MTQQQLRDEIAAITREIARRERLGGDKNIVIAKLIRITRQSLLKRLHAAQDKEETVDVVAYSTKDQVFAGRRLKAGERLPTQRRLPRTFAEECVRKCSPGFRLEIINR